MDMLEILILIRLLKMSPVFQDSAYETRECVIKRKIFNEAQLL